MIIAMMEKLMKIITIITVTVIVINYDNRNKK